MFWPKGKSLIYNSTNLPNLSIIFPNFLHNTLYATWTTPSLNASIFRYVCTHPVNLMGIHFLCYVHGNEHIGTHDAIHDTFVTIA
jgi:hypothetical protein